MSHGAFSFPCFQGATSSAFACDVFPKVCPAIRMDPSPHVFSVLVLLGRGFPSTVLGRVWAVIVNATNAQLFRAFPHIFKKSSETVFAKPLGTNRYPPPSITSVVGSIRVEASLFHGSPGSVCGRYPTVTRRSAVSKTIPVPLKGSGQLSKMFWATLEYSFGHTQMICNTA